MNRRGFLLAISALGCSSDDVRTSGKRISFDTKVSASMATFTDDAGWHIELSRAELALFSLHYFDGSPPVLARREPWYKRPWVKLAHAHPGHYQAGTALGQMLEPAIVNLLVGSSLGRSDGIEGKAKSARVTLGGPPKTQRWLLLEGNALRGAETRAFRLHATGDEIMNVAASARIEGCAVTPAELRDGGVMELAVDLRRWLSYVAFEKLDMAEPVGGHPVKTAFIVGATQPTAYRLTFRQVSG